MAIGGAIKDLPKLAQSARKIISKLSQLAVKAVKVIAKALKGAIQIGKKVFKGAWNVVREVLEDGSNRLRYFFKRAGASVADEVPAAEAKPFIKCNTCEVTSRGRALNEVDDINDLPDAPETNSVSAKAAGVGPGEDHHIATVYDKSTKEMFFNAGMNPGDEANMVRGLPEHRDLRGWVDWREGSFDPSGKWQKPQYKYMLKGHHPEYKTWVNRLLQEAAPAGLTREQARERLLRALEALGPIIREHPDVLTHGPRCCPGLSGLRLLD
jgi:hypothetical protein